MRDETLTDAIMRAITTKLSNTWPTSMIEWAVDEERVQQARAADEQRIRQARTTANAVAKLAPAYHDDAMHEQHTRRGANEAASHSNDQTRLPMDTNWR